jgi:hypothetical protein
MEGAAEEAAAGSGTTADPSFNERVAQEFRTAADLLEAQGAEPFRVQAYRRAASTVESMLESVADVYAREGEEGLIALPTIGRALALAIEDLVERGSWRWLERLQGETDPEALLCTVAGIGPTLAARLHHELDIETLEDLELAAYDGRLAQLGGFGPKRIRAIADSLAARLRYQRPVDPTPHEHREPSTAELLDIDREYRAGAEAGSLPRIAPRRFNPTHERTLPILHTDRDGRHYTAMWSNTPRAHRLHRTRDWVVIYADGHDEGQWTVVTETRGVHAGERVVRGREHQPPR